jgi:hypothetical protein
MRYQVIGCGLIAVTVLAVTTAANVAQDAKATEILAASRKAIGDKKLETLRTLSVNAAVQRNLGNFQTQADVEMLLEMPDKYVRTDVSTGMMNMNLATGFNGDRAILPQGMRVMPGGGTAFTMTVGGAPGAHAPEAEKPTAEQLQQMNTAQLRTYRQEISRFMLGWFGATHPSLKATYTYVGEAESPDGKAYVIDVKDGDGFTARLFIDENSKLPLMVTYQGRQRQVMTSSGAPGAARVASSSGGEQRQTRTLTEEEARKLREQTDKNIADMKTIAAQPAPTVEYSLFFEDWREIDGINFPHVMRRAAKGTTDEEWTVTKVKVNAKLDARKFETKQ